MKTRSSSRPGGQKPAGKPLKKSIANKILIALNQHKRLGLVALLLVVSLAVWGILRLQIETDARKFLPQNTAERRASQQIEKLYGIDSEIIIAYRPEQKVTSAQVLEAVEKLRQELLSLQLDDAGEGAVPNSPEDAESDLLGSLNGESDESAESDLLGSLNGESDESAESDLLGSLNGESDESAESDLLGGDPVSGGVAVATALIQNISTLGSESIIVATKTGELEQLDAGAQVLQGALTSAAAEQSLREWALYDDIFYNDDFSYGALVVEPRLGLSSTEKRRLYQKIIAVLGAAQNGEGAQNLRFFLCGEAVIQSAMGEYIFNDLLRSLPFLGVIICAILYWYFRRFSALFIILFPVVFSLLTTLGIMGWLGIPFTFIHASMPVIIMALGSADSIHTLSHFAQRKRPPNGKSGKSEDKRKLFDSILSIQRELQLPITLTSITTGIGFLSFSTSVMLPIRSFGIFSAVGIGLAWMSSLFITPLLLPLYRRPKKFERTAQEASAQTSLAGQIWKLTCALLRHPYISRFALVVFCGALVSSIPFLPVNNDTLAYFRGSAPIVQASKVVNRELGGIYSIHVSIGSQESGGMSEPKILNYMNNLANYVQERNPQAVNKTIGFQDLALRINELLNPGATALPQSRQTMVQYLSLFSGGMDSFVSPDIYQADNARLTILLKSGDRKIIDKVLANIRGYRSEYLPTGYEQFESGYLLSVDNMNRLVVKEQLRSIIIALIGVFLTVWLSFRSLRLGLIACLPTVLTLLLNLAMMSWLGIDLNISTALINSLAIGVGIDYSIHFISTYRYQMEKNGQALQAAQATLNQVGKSILLNAASVGLGYTTLLLSEFRSLAYFGTFSAMANLVAAVLALLLLPLLLTALKKPPQTRPQKHKNYTGEQTGTQTEPKEPTELPAKRQKAVHPNKRKRKRAKIFTASSLLLLFALFFGKALPPLTAAETLENTWAVRLPRQSWKNGQYRYRVWSFWREDEERLAYLDFSVYPKQGWRSRLVQGYAKVQNDTLLLQAKAETIVHNEGKGFPTPFSVEQNKLREQQSLAFSIQNGALCLSAVAKAPQDGQCYSDYVYSWKTAIREQNAQKAMDLFALNMYLIHSQIANFGSIKMTKYRNHIQPGLVGGQMQLDYRSRLLNNSGLVFQLTGLESLRHIQMDGNLFGGLLRMEGRLFLQIPQNTGVFAVDFSPVKIRSGSPSKGAYRVQFLESITGQAWSPVIEISVGRYGA